MSRTEATDSALLPPTEGLSMLCTHAEFLRHLRLALAASGAGQASGLFAVVAINLAGFRNVNRQEGHAAGDAVLNEAARRIIQCIGPENLAAHDGGDDFLVMLRFTNKETMARPLLKTLSDALAVPYAFPDGPLACPPRFGIASHPHDGPDAERLVRYAVGALQSARSGTRGNTVFHNNGLQEDYAARMRMAEDLAAAHERREFVLHYQPVYTAKTRLLCGAEALLRWNHPEHGQIGPEVFLADAAESGLITAIGQWAFTEICHRIREGLDSGQSVPVSLNIPAAQMPESFPVEWMKQTLLQHRIPAGMLAFELKIENDMVHPERCLPWMKECRQLGIEIHLDDFTGSLPALALLASGDVAEIRIGRALLRHLHTSNVVKTLIQAVIDYSKDSATRISAVGIEDASTADTLTEMGCQSLQGLHLGHVSPLLHFPLSRAKPHAAARSLRLVACAGNRSPLP